MITIHTFKTEHGTLGRNGALGFRDYVVSLDPKYKDWETLGILCDSEIGLHCNEPILLCGGLNGTSYFNNRSPRVRFYIDEIPFGEAEHPWQMTDRIVLTKGYHVLRTRLIDPVADIVTDFWIDHSRETLAHTVWAFRDVDCGRQIIADKNNTLFASAAAFGADTPGQTKLFRESAAAQKIPLELYDIDQEFMTFFEHKIKNFLTHLIEWKNRGVEYIFSLDSRDIVFRHPVEIILGKFNALLEKGKILIAKDLGGVVHPFFYHWLAGELKKIVGKDYEINTGVIAGHVDDLINVYTGIITLREEFLGGVARTELLARLFKYAKEHPSHNRRFDIDNDDQALHFVNMMVYPEWYQLDSNKVLSAFIADFPVIPDSVINPTNAMLSALHRFCMAHVQLHADTGKPCAANTGGKKTKTRGKKFRFKFQHWNSTLRTVVIYNASIALIWVGISKALFRLMQLCAGLILGKTKSCPVLYGF